MFKKFPSDKTNVTKNTLFYSFASLNLSHFGFQLAVLIRAEPQVLSL